MTGKRAPVHQSRWHPDAKMDFIKIGTERFFGWDGRYFPRKDRAVAHMNQIIDRQIRETPPGNPATRKQIMSTWSFRVYKCTHGWGVFFKE